jgi:3-isopropylmalate/(R)-2-methylmalate dehydratase small subunit
MDKFTRLTGIAAPLRMMNVDTDKIIPKQFLKTVKRDGLSEGLFFELRYDEAGNEIVDFVLNKPQYTNAEILIAGENFGCGSSREHAPWALLDFGIRCVIAPSFADIFYNNCFKNGILPVCLDHETVDRFMSIAETSEAGPFSVDLDTQTIRAPNEAPVSFEIDPFRKHCLTNALDDIGLTLQKSDAIATFAARQRKEQPWLFRG